MACGRLVQLSKSIPTNALSATLIRSQRNVSEPATKVSPTDGGAGHHEPTGRPASCPLPQCPEFPPQSRPGGRRRRFR